MSLQRMLTLSLVVFLAIAGAGCGKSDDAASGGAPANGPGASDTGSGSPPPGGAPGPPPPGGAPANDAGAPGMMPGAPPMDGGMPGAPGGAPGGAPAAGGGAPCGVDPAADLGKATKMADLGDQFLKIEAYDLALASYRDALKYEPENRARARQGVARASSLYRQTLSLPRPPKPKRRAQMAQGSGMMSPGGMPGALPGPPGMEGMPGMSGPPGLPGGMSAGPGYSMTEAPMAPPTAMGF